MLRIPQILYTRYKIFWPNISMKYLILVTSLIRLTTLIKMTHINDVQSAIEPHFDLAFEAQCSVMKQFSACAKGNYPY